LDRRLGGPRTQSGLCGIAKDVLPLLEMSTSKLKNAHNVYIIETFILKDGGGILV
jgi:hypothetical protein